MPPETKPATETSAPTIAPADDKEAQIAKLEEEKENYRKAYLKASTKSKDEESEEDRMRRVAEETFANSHIVEITRQQDEIIKSTLKENKELKLAYLNKGGTPPASLGSSSESIPVRDTSITPEQMAYFKSKNWSEKDIERYKHNLRKRV